MQIYKHFDYRLTRKETTGVVFDRIMAALNEAGEFHVDIRFSLKDHLTNGRKILGVDRSVKRFPELEAYKCIVWQAGVAIMASRLRPVREFC